LKVYLLAALVCFCLPGNFAVDDYESDYSDGRDKVSPEHKGVEDVLKNMYQHMLKFDQRLTMVENKLMSSNHKKAEQMKMALTPKTPVQCREYKWLNESTRHFSHQVSSHHQAVGKFCDALQKTYRSPNWNGDGWYRFGSPKGRMANKNEVNSMYRCGTTVSGYLEDTSSLPDTVGETSQGRVKNYYSGSFDRTIKITKCPMYFVFKLPEVQNQCHFRYCSA